MKKPIYYSINNPICSNKNAKQLFILNKLEKYRNLIITPEEASSIADWMERLVAEANEAYPRNREFRMLRLIYDDDTVPSQLSVSDGTERCVAFIMLQTVTGIIEKICDLN